MIHSKKILGLIGLVVFIGGWMYWRYYGPQGSQQASVAAVNQTAAPVPHAPLAASVDHQHVLTPQPLTSKYLNVNPRTVANVREFVEEAKKHPEAGGIFYAQGALGPCMWGSAFVAGVPDNLPYVPGEDRQLVLTRQAALREVHHRCDGLTSNDYDWATSQEMLAEIRRKRDPLLTLAFQRPDASDPDKRERWVQQVVDTANPLLLSQKGIAFSILGPHKENDAISYFDGHWLTEKESDALTAAWQAVPCSMGWSCDQSDIAVLTACARGEGCVASVQEYIDSHWSHGDEQAIKLSREYLAKIMQAINSRNVSIFRAPDNIQRRDN